MKFSDAPNVNRMNRHPGGGQSIIHDTVFNGKLFTFVNDGVSKGLTVSIDVCVRVLKVGRGDNYARH